MNSSSYTERLRNETLYMWRLQNQGQEQKGGLTAETIAARMEGGISLFRQGILPEAPPPSGPLLTCQQLVLLSLQALLQNIANTNPGPTRTARQLYLLSFTLTALYSHCCPTPGRVEGVKDGWDWNVRSPIFDETELVCWFLQGISELMPNFVSSIDFSALLEQERTSNGWTLQKQEQTRNAVRIKGGWDAWKSRWNTWWAQRAEDGYIAAGIAPTASELPNGSSVLNVSDTVDPSTFAQPTKWTPLVVDGKTQKYLTYTWNSVKSTGLTASEETAIKNAALAYYPSNTADRETEVAEVVTITSGLTDQQKMIAEFWAGGPGTVSPPGMFAWFWKECVKAQSVPDQTFFFSFLELGIHLFEISRLIWGLKHDQMQARPIQEIRRLYRGQTLTGYDGLPIQGESWTPYQETNFVTPPFADFPSGHSAFSQVFALVMIKWFGSSVPTNTIESTDINLLSPTLHSQTHPFGSFTMNTGTSQIQKDSVPATPITLTWSTWQEMANQAGISRKYGGIHCTSAHTSSQAAAQECFTQLQGVWGI